MVDTRTSEVGVTPASHNIGSEVKLAKKSSTFLMLVLCNKTAAM
jgi:hypothetical protein